MQKKTTLETMSRQDLIAEIKRLQSELASASGSGIKNASNDSGQLDSKRSSKKEHDSRIESEIIFDLFMEHSPIYVFFKDRDIRSIKLSRNYEKMLNRPLCDILGRTMDELFPSELARSITADDRRILDEGIPITVEENFDGKIYETTKFPIFIDGIPKYLAGYSVDITAKKQIDQTILENEKRFHSIFSGLSNIAVQGYNRDRKVIYWNHASERLYGYTEAEALGKNLEDLIIPDPMREGVISLIQNWHDQGIPIENGELTLRKKNGDPILVYSSHVMIQNLSGEKEMFCIDIDMDASRRMATALKASEERYRDLTENTSDGLWEVDKEGLFTYASPKFIELLGYELEEVLGKSPFDFLHPDDKERIETWFKKTVAEQKPFKRLENRNIHKDGHTVILETSGVPVMNDQGELIGYRGIDRDITDRVNAEQASFRSEELYRGLVEKAGIAVLIDDQSGGFNYYNQPFCELFGYTAEEIEQQSIKSLVHPDDVERVMHFHNQRLMGEDVISRYEFKGLRKNGETIYCEVDAVAEVVNGEIHGTRSYLWDITERKNREEERKKLERKLQKAQRMESIAILSGGIAHQFNNALSVISSSIYFLEEDYKHADDIHKYTEKMNTAVNRMSNLSNQLLAYARGGKYQEKTLTGSDLLKETLPLIMHTVHPEIHIQTDIPEQTFLIRADLTQMQMVFAAILTNASEAIDGKGKIRISCRNIDIKGFEEASALDLNPGKYVNIRIEDNGPGMDEAVRNHIFEPFFTTKVTGRGLGMAATYGIILNHKGNIRADSIPKEGTTIDIYLPEYRELNGNRDQLSDPLPNRKILATVLVIEDQKMVLEMTARLLEKMNFQVITAENGEEAISKFNTHINSIDVVLLDSVLPDMVGKAVYQSILKLKADMKFLICSGFSIDGPASEILDVGADDFIQKPFKPAELSSKLLKLINSSR